MHHIASHRAIGSCSTRIWTAQALLNSTVQKRSHSVRPLSHSLEVSKSSPHDVRVNRLYALTFDQTGANVFKRSNKWINYNYKKLSEWNTNMRFLCTRSHTSNDKAPYIQFNYDVIEYFIWDRRTYIDVEHACPHDTKLSSGRLNMVKENARAF